MAYLYSDGWKIVCTYENGVLIENTETNEQLIVTADEAKDIEDERRAIALMMSVGGII